MALSALITYTSPTVSTRPSYGNSLANKKWSFIYTQLFRLLLKITALVE